MRVHVAGNTTDVESLQMHVHLADTPPLKRLITAQLAGHPWRLFSYFYIRKLEDPSVVAKIWDADTTIMDSGLFSFMFGSEKDAMPATFEAYKAYTEKYLQDLDEWGYKGWLVESDTHRLLGMSATNRLRKLFRDREDRTIFVWHQPEGLMGLEKLALRYDYIAISIPELRMLAGGAEIGGGPNKVARMANDLLGRVHSVCKRNGVLPPRVHLLGCTVEKMMQTSLAWSCDSTSWLSGVRFGNGYVWTDRFGLRSVGLRSEMFKRYKQEAMSRFPEAVKFADEQNKSNYYYDTLACAYAFSQYQQWLDTRYSPVPMRGV